MFAHILAVVRGIDHDRVVGKGRGFQRVKHLADLMIDPFDPRIVGLPCQLHRFRRHVLQLAVVAEMLVIQRQRVEIARRDLGRRNSVLEMRQILRRRDQRVMGGNEADHQEEGLVARAALTQKRDGIVSAQRR